MYIKRKATEIVKPAALLTSQDSLQPTLRTDSAASNKAIPKRTIPKLLQGERLFALFSLSVLVVTTLYWAILGARVNLGNSDQLIDPYLFENLHTFRGAHFPATHTFLLKWPIFGLIAAFHATARSIEISTVAVVLVTVLSLAYIGWRIVRNPQIWAVLMLTLALCLLLVPVQASPQTMLPVNMAMLTTRNLEYIVYLFGLVAIAKVERLRSWRFGIAVLVLGLLFASDRLFLPLSICGAVAILVFGFLHRGRELRRTGIVALSATACGMLLAFLVVLGMKRFSGISYIATASPYELASAREVVLGLIYGVLGVMTNLGVNPAPTTLVLREWPAAAAASLLSLEGIARIAMALAGLYIFTIAWRSFWRRRHGIDGYTYSSAEKLSIMLIGSSVAAVTSFVCTKHYYAGDARYLTIVFFTVYIVAATLLKSVTLPRRWLRDWVALVVVALVAGVYISYTGYSDIVAAQDTVSQRNKAVLQVLGQHQVRTLVGDYWRVVPIRNMSHGAQSVVPLQGCTQPRDVLTSDAWLPAKGQSFAYLLSLEKGQTDYPACNLGEVVASYGRPNSAVVVAGSLQHPAEFLLFYDHGAHTGSTDLGGILPGSGSVSHTGFFSADCPNGTIMQVVAHQDDDLLFMSPDLLKSVQSGVCIRTIYLTAGDSGSGAYYWLGRQQGAEAAYSDMMQSKKGWQSQSVKIAPKQFVTVSSLKKNKRVMLIFFNLPDGNPHGTGFYATNFASLRRLLGREVADISSVDSQSTYTLDGLKQALWLLTADIRPNEVRTHVSTPVGAYADHSDHISTGRIVSETLESHTPDWTESIQLMTYVGYPVNTHPANLSATDVEQKEHAFLQYAAHDNGVCQDSIQCHSGPSYGGYLLRQYTLEQYQTAQ